jgi:hypothetical protein
MQLQVLGDTPRVHVCEAVSLIVAATWKSILFDSPRQCMVLPHLPHLAVSASFKCPELGSHVSGDLRSLNI